MTVKTTEVLTKELQKLVGSHSEAVQEFAINAHQQLKDVAERGNDTATEYTLSVAEETDNLAGALAERRNFTRQALEGRRHVMARKNLQVILNVCCQKAPISHEDLLTIVVKKNINYGSSFDECVKEFGIAGALIRLYDKGNRLNTLLNTDEDELVGESIEDTLTDMAGYALLTLVLLQQHPEYFKK